MNYKKVYCKKSASPTTKRIFEKGKSYYYHEESKKGNFWIILDNTYSVGFRFRITECIRNFNDHFSEDTQKRIERKQKIEKMNENW